MGLTKILDFTRLAAIVILLLHFYFFCYAAFEKWQLTTTITNRLLMNITRTGLFDNAYSSKLMALGLSVNSLMGAKGKKDEKLKGKSVAIWLFTGLFLYFLATSFFNFNSSIETIAITYKVCWGTQKIEIREWL